MTYEQKSAIVISLLRADRDRLLNAFDKIRAEIEERKNNSGGEPNRDLAFNVCLQIIDKYKAESEE